MLCNVLNVIRSSDVSEVTRAVSGTLHLHQLFKPSISLAAAEFAPLDLAQAVHIVPIQVTVCESHSIPGGAAQGWKQDGYHFEAGPSLYSGMASTGRGANPLAHVLQAIGEPLDIIKYNGWNVMIPEGSFVDRVSLTHHLVSSAIANFNLNSKRFLSSCFFTLEV